MILYRTLQFTARTVWQFIGSAHIQGRENIPATGPFFLISNHQSILDPILIQAFCPRIVHTMGKSTQFAAPGLGWLMTQIYSFPVRRFEIDPQAVRLALRRIRNGHPVGVYIEGERSWDGELQPPRLGTVRLLLKAGAPVVPTTIHGSYDACPRWDRRLKPSHLHITFGPPIHLPRLDRRADRERVLHHAAERIMATLQAQLADARSATADATGPVSA